MARSVEVFKENGLEAARLRQEQEATRAKRRKNGVGMKPTTPHAPRNAKRLSERSGRGLLLLPEKDLTYRIEEPLAEAYRKLKDNFNAAMDQMEA